MAINSVILILEFASLWAIRWLFKSYDQGRWCCPSNQPLKTRKKTIQGYVDLYKGPEFEIYYQYAYMLTVVWITFLFGQLIPMLFPIGLIALIVLYLTDRLLLAYSYRAPPVYDRKMATLSIFMLQFATIMYVAIGAWVYSNQQVFRNVVNPRTSAQY